MTKGRELEKKNRAKITDGMEPKERNRRARGGTILLRVAAVVCKACHDAASNRGAVFIHAECSGAVRCGAVRCVAVRIFVFQNSTVRCGVVKTGMA